MSETIKLKDAYKHYAKQLGTKVEMLTAEEKKIALLNWMLEKDKVDERT
jgi:hypothetical protein